MAVVGFQTNMLSYLTRELHLPLTKAANTLTNFNGTAALTPLLGAFIADAYAGRFWTITVASLVYQMVDITPPISFILILFSSGIVIIACRQKRRGFYIQQPILLYNYE